MKMYRLTEEEKVPIIKNWSGREGLQLIKTFTTAMEETCKTTRGLFSILSVKLKPIHKQIVLSLQYCKCKRKSPESDEEWVGRLHTKATDCECKECDRRLTKQFMNALDDETIYGEMIRELPALKDTNEATSNQILVWAQGVEAQKVQK